MSRTPFRSNSILKLISPTLRLLLMGLVFTLLTAGYSVHKRYEVESSNRALAIAAEYETVEAFAASQGLPIEQALTELKAKGLTAVVLGEESLGELIGSGKVAIVSAASKDGAAASALRFNDLSVLPQVQRGLRVRFHDLAGRLLPRGDLLVLPPISVQLARTTTIGLSPEQTSIARRVGLQIIARCGNPAGVSGRTVRETLEWTHELGASVFLPQGDQVLGRRDSIPETLETLESLNMLYASAEFAKIGGDAEMVDKAPGRVVRLHSAQAAEIDKLSLIDAIDRYSKAARERNIRILLVRPVSNASGEPLTSFGDFINSIRLAAEKDGSEMKAPHPYSDPKLPKILFVLIGLSVSPILLAVGGRFTPDSWARPLAGVVALLAVATFSHAGQQLMSIAAAVTFPIAGFLVADELLPRIQKSDFSAILASYLAISIFSVVGGLAVAGLLNGLPYYVKADEFKAVKLAVFLPIVVVGIHYFVSITDWRSDLKAPITWGASALGVGIIAALAVMLARTGNDGGVGASSGEMVFRNLLDRFLYVRPRTKEFLIGNPILVVALGALWRQKRSTSPNAAHSGWVILGLMLGAIGQTSVVNTLCHLHIPVVLSLARIFIGLALGCIIGLGVWAFVRRRPEGLEG